jgi:hypothetical protein
MTTGGASRRDAAVSEPGPAFVVEHYWPNSSPAQFERVTAELEAATVTLANAGLTMLHSTYIPADETAQWVIRAPSADAVAALFTSTGVTFERLLPAIESHVDRRSE